MPDISYKGVVRPATVWARLIGVSESTIHKRIERNWPPEKLLMPKFKPGIHSVKADDKFITHPETGERKRCKEWAKELGMKPASLRDRIRKRGGLNNPAHLAEALDTPARGIARPRRDAVVYTARVDGKEHTLSIQGWARLLKVRPGRIRYQIKKGLSAQDAINVVVSCRDGRYRQDSDAAPGYHRISIPLYDPDLQNYVQAACSLVGWEFRPIEPGVRSNPVVAAPLDSIEDCEKEEVAEKYGTFFEYLENALPRQWDTSCVPTFTAVARQLEYDGSDPSFSPSPEPVWQADHRR